MLEHACPYKLENRYVPRGQMDRYPQRLRPLARRGESFRKRSRIIGNQRTTFRASSLFLEDTVDSAILDSEFKMKNNLVRLWLASLSQGFLVQSDQFMLPSFSNSNYIIGHGYSIYTPKLRTVWYMILANSDSFNFKKVF